MCKIGHKQSITIETRYTRRILFLSINLMAMTFFRSLARQTDREDSHRKIIEKLHKRQGSEKSSKRIFEPPSPTGNRNCYQVLGRVGVSTWSITGEIVQRNFEKGRKSRQKQCAKGIDIRKGKSICKHHKHSQTFALRTFKHDTIQKPSRGGVVSRQKLKLILSDNFIRILYLKMPCENVSQAV